MHHIPAAVPAIPHAVIVPPIDPRVEHPVAGGRAAPATDPQLADDGAAPLPGVRRRGDPNLAPPPGQSPGGRLSGAKARTTGCPCRAPAMANGRCPAGQARGQALHGGKSTGPRTAEGLSSLAAARTTHGRSCAAKRAQHRYERMLPARIRLLTAVIRLQAYLTPALKARLRPVPVELSWRTDPIWAPGMEIPDRTPCTLPSSDDPPAGDAPAGAGRRRLAAGPRPLRGQAAERAAQAPWRAGLRGPPGWSIGCCWWGGG